MELVVAGKCDQLRHDLLSQRGQRLAAREPLQQIAPALASGLGKLLQNGGDGQLRRSARLRAALIRLFLPLVSISSASTRALSSGDKSVHKSSSKLDSCW